MKFLRRCQLSLEVPGTPGSSGTSITIPENCTIEFDVTRKSLASGQTANFKIYNLGEKTRDAIFADLLEVNLRRALQFRAGYEGEDLPLIFNGFIYQAFSYRSGVNFITEVQGYDGGQLTAKAFSAVTFDSNMSVRDMIYKLAQQIPNTTGSPVVGDFPGSSKRPTTFLGNTWQAITTLANGLGFIDNGQVKVIQPWEVLNSRVLTIKSDSGLLGTPRRTNTSVEFDMLFEPRLTVGQLLNLESRTFKAVNGPYKVMGFTHRGTISPAVSGDCRTSVFLYRGTLALKTVPASPQ